MPEPIGQLLDTLGVTHTPDDGEMVTDAVVLLKVVDADGRVAVRTAWSDGMSWVERLGLLHVGVASETPPPTAWRDTD